MSFRRASAPSPAAGNHPFTVPAQATARSIAHRRLHRNPGLVLGLGLYLCLASAAGGQEPAAPAAQNAPAPLIVTPQTASRLAVVASHDLKINAGSVAESRAQIREARSMSALQVSLNAGFTLQGPASSVEFMGEKINFLVTKVQDYSLTLSKILYDFDRTKLTVLVARHGVSVAEQQGRSVEQVAAEMAAEQCYTVLLAQELHTVALQNAAALEEHRRVAERLYHEGLTAFYQIEQARAEVARARQDVATAERTQEVELGDLRKLLVLPQLTALTVHEGRELPDPQYDLQGCIAQAWDHRPDLKADDAQVALAQASLGLAKRTSDPQLVFNADISNRTATALAPTMTHRIGVALQVPLLEGGLERAKVDEARAQITQALERREKLSDDIAKQVQEAWEYVREAQTKQGLVVAEEAAARELLRIQRLRYEASEGTGQEVIDAAATLTRARAAAAEIRYQRAIALCKLQLAMGLPLWEGVP